MSAPVFDVVIPTAGRASLDATLAGVLDPSGGGPLPREVIVVDDSRARRGPAAARNAGWSVSAAEWVVFVDDDVVPPAGWRAALARDLAAAADDVAGVQARIRVPLPDGRRPTDAERNVAGLERARWATADMAFRRRALESVGGFDERFPRAYREDCDLALRLLDAGWRLVQGERVVEHPVRPATWAESIRRQRGNADDALMRRLHGRDWRARGGVPRGAFRRHVATTAALAGTVVLPHPLRRIAASVWVALTADFAGRRIAPGPRTGREVSAMVVTSAAIPVVAVWHRAAGEWRHRRVRTRPHAVLFDRDGTLVVDVPYNGDPDKVRLMPDARDAVERLRRAGVRTAVISNQSGIARGLLTHDDVERVRARVEQLLGAPLGPWVHCPHAPDDGCRCRKPEPGMVLRAAELLGVDPARVAVIGDIGADVEAAARAGARGVLVPTAATRREEVEAAPEVAVSLVDAVDRLLGARR